MSRQWFGDREYFTINPIAPGADAHYVHIPLGEPIFHFGDKLLRVLFGWEMETDLTDGAGSPGLNAWPVIVKLAFVPDPDGDLVDFQPNVMGTSLLWREAVDWRPRYFTDGTTHSWKWEARSGQMRSSPANRDLKDVDVDELVMAVGFDSSAPGFPGTVGYQPLNASGYVWCEFLMEM